MVMQLVVSSLKLQIFIILNRNIFEVNIRFPLRVYLQIISKTVDD